ncbi:MAG: DUF4143 domain-containing protein [Clostridiales bacterium]|nr:DUF4143 domain-containing protein [Clostridiales bacterium]
MPMMKPDRYVARLVDDQIETFLSIFGAVQIEGPKYCGKTWAARAHANSEVRLDNRENRELAVADPNLVIKGEYPRLIDEWQEVPSIRDDVRSAIDISGNEPGQFLLTGSSVPPRGSYVHSGAGRIARIHMRPMSLYEMGFSDGRISLGALFNGEPIESFSVEPALDAIASNICHGGWPAAHGRPISTARAIAQQYLESVFEDSAPRMGKTPEMARKAFSSLARNNATAATLDTLASDMAFGEHDDFAAKPARTTVESYLDFFRDIYLLDELAGWDAPIRSKKRLRTKPKRYVVDPSLAVSMLGINDASLLKDFQTFGMMFENMCLRDLRVYASVSKELEGSTLRYYLDDSGLEVDVIIELRDGRWGGIEIKLSEDKVAEGVKNLLSLKDRVAENKGKQIQPPVFLAVLAGRVSFARTTPEGVHVIPVTSLTA